MKMYRFQSRWEVRKDIANTIMELDPAAQIEYGVDPGPKGFAFIRTGTGVEFQGPDFHAVFFSAITHLREVQELSTRLVR